MNARTHSVIWFGLRFVPLFAVFLWLYPRVLPTYEALVIDVAERCLAVASPGLQLELQPDGHLASRIVRPGGKVEPVADLAAYRPLEVFAQLPLVAALLLATPMRATRLFRQCAIALFLVFGMHVLGVIVVFYAWFHAQVVPHSIWYDWLGLIGLTSGQMGAFAVWGLLTWGYWLSLARGGDGGHGSKRAR